MILIAGAAGLLSYSLLGTEDFGWLSARTFGLLVAGLVVLAVFVIHQQHTKAPALDLDLFRIPNFRWANVAMLVFGTAFAALFFGSILFLTDVWGWSVLQAGFGVAPGPVVVGLVAPRAGKLAGRVGQRPLLITGGVLYAGCGLFRLTMLGPHVNYLRDFFPSMVLSGLGVALVFPQLSSVVAQALPPGRAGVGGAAAQAVRQFGGTFGSRSPSRCSGPRAPSMSASTGSGGSSSSVDSPRPPSSCRCAPPARTLTSPGSSPPSRSPSSPPSPDLQENQHEDPDWTVQ